MNMKTRLASLALLAASTAPLLSNTELDRLRALATEQELQIRQLEQRIAQLTDTPPPSRNTPTTTAAGDFLPAEQPAPAPAAAAATHTVKAGDSLERIANRHQVTTARLAAHNGLRTNSIIHPGQKIKIPGATTTTSQRTATPHRTHTIKSGDTFYRISLANNISVKRLTELNPKVNPNALRVGQVITISPGTTPSVAKTTAPSPAPAPSLAPSLAPSPTTPVANTPPPPAPAPRATDRPIEIKQEITYGDFARKHTTTTARLNDLNGLDLAPSTVLAKGSELYVPAQP